MTWGEWGSATEHKRYAMSCEPTQRKCRLGEKCGNRVTHVGKANGVALTSGCQFHVFQWAHGS